MAGSAKTGFLTGSQEPSAEPIASRRAAQAAGSGGVDGLGFSSIVGHDDHAAGLEDHLVFGSLMGLAVNGVEQDDPSPLS
jgi:hypothetical protein